MIEANDILRLNVGFIIHEGVGYLREFPLEAEKIQIPPDLTLTDLQGSARVTRTTQGLLVQVIVSAYTQAECVRCLIEFPQRLEVDFTDLYAFTPDSMTESGLRVPDTGKINLAPIIREEMLLAMPIGPVCEEDCRGLCLICGENLNENPHLHPEESTETSD